MHIGRALFAHPHNIAVMPDDWRPAHPAIVPLPIRIFNRRYGATQGLIASTHRIAGSRARDFPERRFPGPTIAGVMNRKTLPPETRFLISDVPIINLYFVLELAPELI